MMNSKTSPHRLTHMFCFVFPKIGDTALLAPYDKLNFSEPRTFAMPFLVAAIPSSPEPLPQNWPVHDENNYDATTFSARNWPQILIEFFDFYIIW